jgi:hypothetical protein
MREKQQSINILQSLAVLRIVIYVNILFQFSLRKTYKYRMEVSRRNFVLCQNQQVVMICSNYGDIYCTHREIN